VRAYDDGTLTADTLQVYPTALKARSVLQEHARTAGCLLGHRVTTFPELTDDLARDLGVTARVLDPEMAAVVLADALQRTRLPGPLGVPRRGLLRELLRTIAELQAAYLSPADVAALADAIPTRAAASRLAALAHVYAAYDAALDRIAAVDRHGREWRVCEGLAACEADGRVPSTLAGVRRIVFAEIYDFSVLQFLIATSLIRLVGDAELVAFAHAENVDATRFLDRTWNRFVGDAGIADQVLPSFVARGGRQGSLAAALRGVFVAERPTPEPGDGSVRVVVAPSRYREVEAAVRDIRGRAERGDPLERIAIVARELAVYGDLIEDVCRRYRVPVYFRKGRPLLANGLVKACLDVVRCVTDGFPRARLEALVDSDYLGAPRPRLARVLRRVGYVAEAARPLADCLAHHAAALAVAAEAGDEHAASRATSLGRDGARLLDLMGTLRGLDGRRTVARHVRALQRTLRRLRVRPVPGAPVLPPSARRDARAWERFQETLAFLGGLADELRLGAMPLDDFLRLLVAVLEPLEVEDAAEPAGSVRALGVLDARGLDFDVVYLLGLDDGTFPAPRGESPLLPDATKREVNRIAADLVRRRLGARADGLPLGGLLRTAREASLEDPFLFFLALSMAEREVVLSYPAVNEKGNPTVPSPFLDEVKACIQDVPWRELDPRTLVPPAEECCALDELVGRASLGRWSRRSDAPPDGVTPALAAARPELASRLATIDVRARIEERRGRYFLSARGDVAKDALADPFVGRLGGDASLVTRVAAMEWSPRRLEALGTCGFKFFARYLLGLEEDVEPDTGVGAAERGTLVHAALAALFAEHPVLPRDVDQARAVARELVASIHERLAKTIAAKDPFLLDVTWRQIAATVDRLVVAEHDAALADGVTVEHILETSLACPLPDPAGGPPLVLRGTPDRIDVHRCDGRVVGVRVVDYKMSRTAERYRPLIDPTRELGKTGFQIPVYLLAALAALGDTVAEDVALTGGFWLLLADGKQPVREFTRALLAEVGARIGALVARARDGRFDVDPDPCDVYCPYRPACRYQRPPLEEDVVVG